MPVKLAQSWAFSFSTDLLLFLEEPADFSDDGGTRVALKVGHGDDLPSRRFDFFLPHNFLMSPIAAFNQDIRNKGSDNFLRRVFGKRGQEINVFYGLENFPPLGQGKDRPGRPFNPPHRGVIVESYDQDVAPFLGFLEKPDVTGMKDIKTTVGENDFLAFPPEFVANPNQRLDGKNLLPLLFC